MYVCVSLADADMDYQNYIETVNLLNDHGYPPPLSLSRQILTTPLVWWRGA